MRSGHEINDAVRVRILGRSSRRTPRSDMSRPSATALSTRIGVRLTLLTLSELLQPPGLRCACRSDLRCTHRFGHAVENRHTLASAQCRERLGRRAEAAVSILQLSNKNFRCTIVGGECPLCPRKRTCSASKSMSAKCQ